MLTHLSLIAFFAVTSVCILCLCRSEGIALLQQLWFTAWATTARALLIKSRSRVTGCHWLEFGTFCRIETISSTGRNMARFNLRIFLLVLSAGLLNGQLMLYMSQNETQKLLGKMVILSNVWNIYWTRFK